MDNVYLENSGQIYIWDISLGAYGVLEGTFAPNFWKCLLFVSTFSPSHEEKSGL